MPVRAAEKEEECNECPYHWQKMKSDVFSAIGANFCNADNVFLSDKRLAYSADTLSRSYDLSIA